MGTGTRRSPQTAFCAAGKQHAAYQAMQKLGIDRLDGRGDVGIITAGVAYAYVKEVLEEFGASDQVQVLKLTSIHPVPRKQIETILGSTKKCSLLRSLSHILRLKCVQSLIGWESWSRFLARKRA